MSDEAALRKEFRDEIERLGQINIELGKMLMPFYVRRKQMKQDLARTYPHDEIDEDAYPFFPRDDNMTVTRTRVVVTRYAWPTSSERADIREELDRLSEAHRPLINDRSEADRLRKAYLQKLKLLDGKTK